MAVTLTYPPHHLFLPLTATPVSTRTPKAALLHAWSPSTPAAPPCISLLCAPRRRDVCSPHQPPLLAPATLTAAPSGCRRTASTAPLSILPPVVKAPSEDDVAFGEASWRKMKFWAWVWDGFVSPPMLALDLGLGWSTSPSLWSSQPIGLAHSMDVDLSLEPSPSLLMGGLMAPQASHPHGPSPCWASPFGCLNSKKK